MLQEDKGHKSKWNAKVCATINDLLAFFFKQEKITQKNVITLQSIFLAELILLLKYFYRTMLK